MFSTYWLWPWGTEWMSLSCPFPQWISVHFSSHLSELLWGSEIKKVWMQNSSAKKITPERLGYWVFRWSVKSGLGWRRVHENVRQRSTWHTTLLAVASRALSSLSACLAQCKAASALSCCAERRGWACRFRATARSNHHCTLSSPQNWKFTVTRSWGCELSMWSTSIRDPRSLSSGPVIFRLLPALEIRLLNIEGTLWVKISPDLGEMWNMFAKRNRVSFLPSSPHLFYCLRGALCNVC